MHHHQGYPSTDALLKLLREAKPIPDAFKAVAEHQCNVCLQYASARRRPRVRMPAARAFNEVLQMDVKHLRAGVLHIVDGNRVPHRDLGQWRDALRHKRWTWAGPMKVLMVDPATGMTSQEMKLESRSAWASCQTSLVERCGDFLRDMVGRTMGEHPEPPTNEHLDDVLEQCCAAKNRMHQVRRYYPAKWMLAQAPREVPRLGMLSASSQEGDFQETLAAREHVEHSCTQTDKSHANQCLELVFGRWAKREGCPSCSWNVAWSRKNAGTRWRTLVATVQWTCAASRRPSAEYAVRRTREFLAEQKRQGGRAEVEDVTGDGEPPAGTWEPELPTWTMEDDVAEAAIPDEPTTPRPPVLPEASTDEVSTLVPDSRTLVSFTKRLSSPPLLKTLQTCKNKSRKTCHLHDPR